jgi:hypothetical protein
VQRIWQAVQAWWLGMTRLQHGLLGGLALVILGAGTAAGLVASSSGTATPVPSSPSPSPAATTPGATALRSPFTGEPVTKLGPVLAVKIDNIVYARPQTGLRSADIVYVLPVEGGLSRFMAVFSSHIPPVIGPVRSAREDDLELLAQFGKPAFAYSGAAPHLLPFIHRAPIVDLYAGTASGYYRSSSRVAPYNLYASGRALVHQAAGASDAKDIGFRFGPLPGGGRVTSSYSASYSAASYDFRWSRSAGRWLVWIDGTPALATEGGQLGGATVIVQYTVVKTSRFLEYGSRPPFAESTGSGRAVVLRDGRAFDVHWSRPNKNDGTTYTLPSGQRMTFAPGQVWVMLIAR